MKIIDKSKRVALVPDIHQDIDFANHILKAEDDGGTHFVFMGDYFDHFSPRHSIKKTCNWLTETQDRLGDRATWLIGNHDLAYLSTYLPNTHKVRVVDLYKCSGWSRSKAKEVNKNLPQTFWDSLQLGCQVHEYVVSHAGFQSDYTLEQVEAMTDAWNEEKNSFADDPMKLHWIGFVGQCRGGRAKVGSPVWMDWNHEFLQSPHFNQIVGHTTDRNNPIRRKGDSYCIDGYQTTFAVLEPNQVKPTFIIQV